MTSRDRKFKDHFSTLARGYSAYRPDYPNTLFAYICSIAPARDMAWDCATGSGQAAIALAQCFSSVIATDASAHQIEQATATPRVEYRVATAEKPGLDAGSIDLISVAQALHWFDIPRFMQEAQRVLKPQGVLAVWTYNLFRITPQIDAVVDDLYWNILDGFWADERKLVETGYRGLALPFKELKPPQFKMSVRWSLDHLMGYLGTWSAVRNYRETNDEDPVAKIGADLVRAWDGVGIRRKVFWPLSLRVGINGQ